MEDSKIKIGFTFTDHFGNEFAASSTVKVFEDHGESDLDVIGECLDVFLSQVGYVREGGCMLMESLSEEELWALQDYLQELRSDEKKAGEVILVRSENTEM